MYVCIMYYVRMYYVRMCYVLCRVWARGVSESVRGAGSTMGTTQSHTYIRVYILDSVLSGSGYEKIACHMCLSHANVQHPKRPT